MDLNISPPSKVLVAASDQVRDTNGSDRWLVRFRSKPSARLRLFCLPYAGGGASAYFKWASEIHSEIELVAVQLPGREERIRENPLNRVADVVDQLVGAIGSNQDRPYALFGHSLGAFIAFETARALLDRGYPGPSHLFVSAQRAPHCRYRYPNVHHLPDEFLIGELLQRWNGIPAGILNEPDLLNLLLPAMRADVRMVETYVYTPGTKLELPISVFGGDSDDTVTREELLAWQEHSRGRFHLTMIPGSHFFLRSRHEQIVKAISAELLPVLESIS